MSSVTAETLLLSYTDLSSAPHETISDRRADVEAKQAQAAALLQEAECEGLLLLDPDNFTWMTSGGAARGVLDPGEMPALYFTAEQRWVLASNVDSQRLFDEEINGLGFQLKEWPWHWGREQLLADLQRGRKLACDQPFGDSKPVGDRLRVRRRTMTTYEQGCYGALGQIVGHALEATCRHLQQGESEREVAGQLSHRLLHRGATPLRIEVAGDGRSRLYRQGGFTARPIDEYAVLTVTGRKYGLCATASRTVCFGRPDPDFAREHDTACKVSATYLASTWPDAVPRDVLALGRKVYLLTDTEHEWRLAPPGHVTGRSPVELAFLPKTEETLQAGWAVTWQARVGAASSCDTFLVAEDGPRVITPTESWPAKRIRVQGAEFFRPDMLIR
jgi:Xaa-Pro aminopeptidase